MHSEHKIIRRYFSLSSAVKSVCPDSQAQEKLTWDLAVYYREALFATPEDPVITKYDGVSLRLFPSFKNGEKIRVTL